METPRVGPSFYPNNEPLGRWRHYASKINRAWVSTQVSHRGRYSIERLVALDEYVRNSSWYRVVFVCVGTPLPVIVLVLAQEAIPLQDPADGWRVNYGIWIRAAAVAVAVTRMALVQLNYLVDGATISSIQIVIVVIAATFAHVAQCLVVAANFAFPIPFLTNTLTLPYFGMFAIIFRIVVGKQVFKEILRHRGQLIRFVAFVSAQTLMSVIYPAYQVLFLAAANAGYELYVIALLPIVKLFMKNVMALNFTRMHDMMPESVIFSVDFFNAFYIATSMQSATSTTTVVVIMASDLLNSAIALNHVYKTISSIVNLLPSDKQSHFELLEVACSLCRQPEEFENQERVNIQLQSCIPYRISPAGRDLLETLSAFRGYRSYTRSFSHRQVIPANPTVKFTKDSQWCCIQRRSSSIQPVVEKRVVQVKRSNTSISIGNVNTPIRTQHSELLGDSLKVLFTAECHVLSEYLESVVPILYANYIMVMVHLSSARYHSEMTGITKDNVGDKVKAVFAYAVMEFLSFILMAIVIHRKCGMKILYHLAFVLETHMPLVQDKLITWTLLTLASRVVHFGVDFTFKFAWV